MNSKKKMIVLSLLHKSTGLTTKIKASPRSILRVKDKICESAWSVHSSTQLRLGAEERIASRIKIKIEYTLADLRMTNCT